MYAENSPEFQVEIKDTAFGKASNALIDAGALASRVSDLVDRLCGSTLSEVANSSKLSGGSSIFSNLRDEATRTLDVVRRAHSQLDRLEREIS